MIKETYDTFKILFTSKKGISSQIVFIIAVLILAAILFVLMRNWRDGSGSIGDKIGDTFSGWFGKK